MCVTGKHTHLQIHSRADCWEGTFNPEEKGIYRILGINETLPVVDHSNTGGKNVRPIDYLCAVYQVEHTGHVSKPVQFLDIVSSGKTSLCL